MAIVAAGLVTPASADLAAALAADLAAAFLAAARPVVSELPEPATVAGWFTVSDVNVPSVPATHGHSAAYFRNASDVH